MLRDMKKPRYTKRVVTLVTPSLKRLLTVASEKAEKSEATIVRAAIEKYLATNP